MKRYQITRETHHSKTVVGQSEASNRELANALFGEMVAKVVKGSGDIVTLTDTTKEGRDSILRVHQDETTEMRQARRARERAARIASLKHQAKEAADRIVTFADSLKVNATTENGSPLGDFEWAHQPMESAAKLKVVRVALLLIEKEGFSFARVVDYATEHALNGAKWPSFSTSATSNLSKTYETAAWAQMAEDLKWHARDEEEEQKEIEAVHAAEAESRARNPKAGQ